MSKSTIDNKARFEARSRHKPVSLSDAASHLVADRVLNPPTLNQAMAKAFALKERLIARLSGTPSSVASKDNDPYSE